MTFELPLRRNSKTLQNEVRNYFSCVSHGDQLLSKIVLKLRVIALKFNTKVVALFTG